MTIFVGNEVKIKHKVDVTKVDITNATNYFMTYKKPDGTVATWNDLTIDDNSFIHKSEEGEIDQAGTWYVQTYAEIPDSDWSGRGDIVSFRVKNIL